VSADPTQAASEPRSAPQDPSEEELRAAYEAELSRITSTEMMAQAVVSLLNIAARRLGPPVPPPGAAEPAGAPPAGVAGRDLEQVRDSIDAVRALLEILERRVPGELRSLRDALSQLQIAYAREVRDGEAQEPAPTGAAPGSGGPAASPGAAGQRTPPGGEESGQPGPAQSSGRLWVPGQ
jgi:hypothetical protein